MEITASSPSGDVHGCSPALGALVEAIRPGPEDTLIPLGDYIDFGLDSRGVLDQLIALAGRCRVVPLLGNHEEMALTARSDPEAVEAWLGCGGQAPPDSYGSRGGLEMIPPEHWRFLGSCRDYFETDGHIFVHANYLPHLPMDRQPNQFLRWEHLTPLWTKAHCSGKVVIVGHTPQTGG